ncbi:hypothetical protein NW752_010524 [Fusarium irregulare]|uniref:Protein kinase domain-containing protein n=1 Tax=Fusarium irregulare TaxID=2494466 RepID=A0A9W8PR01_9HYPO|nr:hypothetical protein NW752_010524 [Fusarium irregulare]KAJ4014936.1 hypothetical protein NW766_005255 [Fusarium irregulare]
MIGRDIKIKMVRIQPTGRKHHQELTRWRNLCTINSALIRGVTSVILYDWDHIPKDQIGYIRRAKEEIEKQRVSIFPALTNTPEGPDLSGVCKADSLRDIESTSWEGLRFKFVKVLAEGGQGYVSLWDVTFDDGSIRRVVIKKGKKDSSSFDPVNEARFHLRYEAAEHTTQVIKLSHESAAIRRAMMKENPTAANNFTEGCPWDAAERRCVVFEYAPYGDVSDLMSNMATTKQNFPNSVLWGVLECYALGLATVAYTPVLDRSITFEHLFREAEQNNEADNFLEKFESIHTPTHDIHLDMEYLNILIGQEQSHKDRPAFKLHDLGAFSEIMSEYWGKMTEIELWRLRHFPKPQAVTPEQITGEWDCLPLGMTPEKVRNDFGGEDFKKGSPCAGRFGTWTNVFLIAKVMESMITGVSYRHPFVCKRYESLDGKTRYTYGWALKNKDFSWVDRELRDIVCRCLFENPVDRPTPIQILKVIQQWKNSAGYDPREIARWWAALYGPQQVPSHIPKPPAANVNPVQQAVIHQQGLLALHPGVQVTDTRNGHRAPNQPTQHVTGPSNQQQSQSTARSNQGGVSPRQTLGLTQSPVQAVPPPSDLQPPGSGKKAPVNTPSPPQKRPREESTEPTEDMSPLKIQKLGGSRILAHRPQGTIQAVSSSSSPPAFLAAANLTVSNNTRHLRPALSPTFPVVATSHHSSRSPPASLLADLNIQSITPPPPPSPPSPMDTSPLLSGSSKTRPGTAIQSQSNGIGPGEAMDIDREESFYQFDGDRNQVASPLIPPGQGPNNLQRQPPSTGWKMSINRATQRPAKYVKFDMPPSPDKELKAHVKILSPKIQGVVRGPSSKKPKYLKSKAMRTFVQKALPHMPVTLRNLMSRTKELDSQLTIGTVPVYAYLK